MFGEVIYRYGEKLRIMQIGINRVRINHVKPVSRFQMHIERSHRLNYNFMNIFQFVNKRYLFI